MKKTPIGTVVVTYKTRDLLKKCLNSLCAEANRAGLSLELCVVDNASGDGTAEMIKGEFPSVNLIANSTNLGPACAFNQGIARIIDGVDKMLILNSDIEVQPGTLETMVNYLETHPEVDGVSGPLLNEDGTLQYTRTHIWSFWKPDPKKKFRVEFIGTTFALIRTSVFRRIGGYDENYYFYNEDLDWATRAKRQECFFMYLPSARVIHFLGRGKIQNQSRILRELYPGSIYYFKKFYPNLCWLNLLLMHLEIGWQIFKLLLRRKLILEQDGPARFKILMAIKNYKEACAQMDKEYRTRRFPKVPFWGK